MFLRRKPTTVLRSMAAMSVGAIAMLSSHSAEATPTGGATAPGQMSYPSPTVYAFTSLSKLVDFIEGRSQAAPATEAGSSAYDEVTTVRRKSDDRIRLNVFAWVPASEVANRDEAVRLFTSEIQRAPSSTVQATATMARGAAASDTSWAAVVESAQKEPGYALYWGNQTDLDTLAVSAWEMRTVVELEAASSSWPAWLYVRVREGGVQRLVQGGGRTAALAAPRPSTTSGLPAAGRTERP